jgi:hypothetical protein
MKPILKLFPLTLLYSCFLCVAVGVSECFLVLLIQNILKHF